MKHATKDTFVSLTQKKCEIKNKKLGNIVGIAMRNKNNVYILGNENQSYLNMVDESWLWHRMLGHLSFDSLSKIRKKEVVRDLPKLKCTNISHTNSTF